KTPRSFLLSAAALDCISTNRPRLTFHTSLNVINDRYTGNSPTGAAPHNRSAIALDSPDRFSIGSIHVVYIYRIGLAVFVDFQPATAEVRAGFGRNVDVTFSIFHDDR